MISNYLCAVIDIGSNSVRMVIYAGPATSPIRVMNLSSYCKLGDFEFKNEQAFLKEKRMEMTLDTLSGFMEVLSKIPKLKVIVIATAALRTAVNGKEFANEIKQKIGFDIKILSGKQEAKYVAYGVVSQLPKLLGTKKINNHLVLDLGGGSLELVYADSPKKGNSFPIGLLTIQKNLGADITDLDKKLTDYLNNNMDNIHKVKYLTPGGGPFRSMMILFKHFSKSKAGLNGFYLPTKKVIKLCETISQIPLDEIRRLKLISESRVLYLHFSIKYLLTLIKIFNPKYIVSITGGVREGAIYHNLLGAEKTIDPLLSAALDYAKPHFLLSEQRSKLEKLCINHVDYAGLQCENDFLSVKRLITVSLALVHISSPIQPNFRAKYADRFISNVALPFISPEMRLGLRIILLLRYGGEEKKLLKELKNNVPKKFLRAVLFLGNFYRLLFKSSVIGWNETVEDKFIFDDAIWYVQTHKNSLWKDKNSFKNDFKTASKYLGLKAEIKS